MKPSFAVVVVMSAAAAAFPPAIAHGSNAELAVKQCLRKFQATLNVTL